MVICHFGGIKDLLRLRKWPSLKRLGELLVALQTSKRLGTFRIDVIAEEGGVHTWIGGELLLVEQLDELQCLLGRVAKLSVAIHLQRGQVVETRRRFRALLLLDILDREGLSLDGLKHSPTLLLGRIFYLFIDRSFALDGLALLGCRFHLCRILRLSLLIVGYGCELRISIEGGEHPTLLGYETLNLLLATHNQRQSGCLHSSNGEHLLLLSVFEGVEASGVHAQSPVADGSAKPRLIERLVFYLIFQAVETLADGLLGQRGNPESLDRTFCPSLLHDPPLNQFSLLPSIATVDDAVRCLHQLLDGGELTLHPFIILQTDAETLRNHGEVPEVPTLPTGIVLIRLLQLAQMSERPSDLIAVALDVALLHVSGTQHIGDVTCHTRFLCYANNHFPLCWSCNSFA